MPVALVTGASRGIGRAVASRLARDGHHVVATARALDELESLSAEVAAGGGSCQPLLLDLADHAAVAREFGQLEVDVLINNAGIGAMKPFVELSPEEWHGMLDVNVNALYHVTRAVLPGMIARGRGHVCTVGSISGRSAYVGGSCYAGTKAFVTAWSESLMLEVRDHGVKVSVVMPGAVATEFGGKSPSEADAWKLTAADVAEAIAQVVATPPNVLIHRVEVRTLTVPAGKTRR